MAEEQRDDPQWLVAPPGPGEIHISIRTGEGVELSESARQSLETLVAELQASEVEGFGQSCPSFLDCTDYKCTLQNCQPQWKNPCLVDYGCKVAEFFPMG